MDGRTISTEIPDSAAPAKDIRTRVRTHPPMVLSAMEREIKAVGTVGLLLGIKKLTFSFARRFVYIYIVFGNSLSSINDGRLFGLP